VAVLRAHGRLSRRATPRQRLRHIGHAYPQQIGYLTNPLAIIRCDSAWKKDPLGGVIGVQKGPLW